MLYRNKFHDVVEAARWDGTIGGAMALSKKYGFELPEAYPGNYFIHDLKTGDFSTMPAEEFEKQFVPLAKGVNVPQFWILAEKARQVSEELKKDMRELLESREKGVIRKMSLAKALELQEYLKKLIGRLRSHDDEGKTAKKEGCQKLDG